MLFCDIEEEDLCIMSLDCDFLKYVGFNEIFCEISKSDLLLSILVDPLSYEWVRSETREEGTRVFYLNLPDCTWYLFLKGRIILNVICQELQDWPPTKALQVYSCSGSRYFSLNTSHTLRTRMNTGHSHT